jgi:hypothetical protein
MAVRVRPRNIPTNGDLVNDIQSQLNATRVADQRPVF